MLGRRRPSREIEEEMRHHLELEAASLRAQGLTEEEARRQSRIRFGSVDGVAEACQERRGLPRVESVVREFRQSLRALARVPGFSIAVISVVGLGIGFATAAFALVQMVLMRPLAFADEDRLFSIYEADSTSAPRTPSWPGVREWREQTRQFESIAYVRGETLGVRTAEGTRLLLVAYSSGDLFRTLKARPLIGRVFSEAEAERGDPVAVITHHIWRDQFGRDPKVVGRTLSTEMGPYSVIGVMPEGARYPSFTDVWLPLGALPASARQAIERRDLHVDAQTVGRILPTTTVEQAAAELKALSERAALVHPDTRGWTAVLLRTVRSETLGNAPGRLLMLGIATLLLLLVACVNVAGLLVARGAARAREISVRAALGASPQRLAGQMLIESILLATAGGALGIALAVMTVRIVTTQAPTVLPRLEATGIDPIVYVFAVAVSALTALLFGLIPARRAGRVAPMDALRASLGVSGERSAERVRAALIVVETALAAILVVHATSVTRSMIRLGATDLGFETSGMATVRVIPPLPRYEAPEAALLLYSRLEEEVGNAPGVESVALVNHLPLSGTSMVTDVRTSRVPDPLEPSGSLQAGAAFFRSASTNYFEMLGVTLLQGRSFSRAEVESRAPVAVVNEALANREWPGRSPVGESVTIRKVAQSRPDFGEEIALTVVGVTRDIFSFGPARPEPPAIYAPYTLVVWGNMYIIAKGNTGGLVDAVRSGIERVDPSIPVAGPGFAQRVRLYDEYAAGFLRTPRINASVLVAFAGTALLLAAVGLFGVIAYLVLRRRREFGVHLALGATRSTVMRLVLREAVLLVSSGLAIGFAGAFALGKLAGSTSPLAGSFDPTAFLISGVVFLGVALSASALPALRASRVAPARTLREEG
jgi:putative ABC transport system permease protein